MINLPMLLTFVWAGAILLKIAGVVTASWGVIVGGPLSVLLVLFLIVMAGSVLANR